MPQPRMFVFTVAGLDLHIDVTEAEAYRSFLMKLLKLSSSMNSMSHVVKYNLHIQRSTLSFESTNGYVQSC